MHNFKNCSLFQSINKIQSNSRVERKHKCDSIIRMKYCLSFKRYINIWINLRNCKARPTSGITNPKTGPTLVWSLPWNTDAKISNRMNTNNTECSLPDLHLEIKCLTAGERSTKTRQLYDLALRLKLNLTEIITQNVIINSFY